MGILWREWGYDWGADGVGSLTLVAMRFDGNRGVDSMEEQRGGGSKVVMAAARSFGVDGGGGGGGCCGILRPKICH